MKYATRCGLTFNSTKERPNHIEDCEECQISMEDFG